MGDLDRHYNHSECNKGVFISSRIINRVQVHSLCLVYGLGHGEEDAVDQDGEHDHVVEVLVRTHVDRGATELEQRGEGFIYLGKLM